MCDKKDFEKSVIGKKRRIKTKNYSESNFQRKCDAEKRKKELIKIRTNKMCENQILSGDYTMVDSKTQCQISISEQRMDQHIKHCRQGCKTMYEDQDIKCVSVIDRTEHCKKIENMHYQLLAQNVLTIEFMDGTFAEIVGQYYFCTDENDQYVICGNLSCHNCDATLYCMCTICQYVPSDVTYRFSKEKYKN